MGKKLSEKQEALDAIIREYLTLKGTPYVEGNPAMGIVYRRLLRPATDILKASAGDRTLALTKLREVKQWADSNTLSWALETVIKRWFEDNSPKSQPIYTDEHWKDGLEKKDPEQSIKIDKGIQSIRDILKTKGIKKD